MTYWNNKTLVVIAHSLPKYLWTTATIDVLLGGQCILRTGGQAKLTGGHSASFTDDGAQHQVTLTWGQSTGEFGFPYEVSIDGAKVDEGTVQIDNPYMMYIPAPLIIIILFSIIGAAVYWAVHSFYKTPQ